MQRLREVLLTQYIGAIVIGMLITHAFVTVIGLLVQPLFLYAEAKGVRFYYAVLLCVAAALSRDYRRPLRSRFLRPNPLAL